MTEVVVAPFFRRRRVRVAFSKATPPSTPPAARRPCRAARALALAHHLEQAIEGGHLLDQAGVAYAVGLTRPRLSQLMMLRQLAPDLQARVLAFEAIDGREPITERALRHVATALLWSEQRVRFESEISRRRTSRVQR